MHARFSENLPINGFVDEVSFQSDLISKGMHFSFDGRSLFLSSGEPLSDIDVMQLLFSGDSDDELAMGGIIEGRVIPSGQRVFFYASGKAGIKDRGLVINAISYWVLFDDYALEDIERINIYGLSIESFCPSVSIEAKIKPESHEISVRSDPAKSLDLGSAYVSNREISMMAESYWEYEFLRHIKFYSRISCLIDRLDHSLIKSIYIAIAASIRFCLGRGNVDFDIDLCVNTPNGYIKAGEFYAVHGSTYIPDELDEPERSFVRAKDIGAYFGRVVTAFDSGEFRGSELSSSRDNSKIVTLSKIIELTSSFEREFHDLFPDGVKHRTKTQRAREQAKNAMLDASENLKNDSKSIVRRLCRRIDEDNLETRIRYACKSIPENISIAVFENTGANKKYTQLGKKITTMRNDIAHGNKLTYGLDAVCSEYKLLIRLVFAMRLMRVGVDNNDISRLVKCLP